MLYGVIKWFNDSKGYGFITGDDGQDYFVHYSGFSGGTTRGLNLVPGDRVSFDAKEGKQGMAACNVELILYPV